MLHFDRQLPAKVMKRVSQLRRLGARGLMHTAYVRVAGPAVYSLADSGRAVSRKLHRHRVLGRSHAARVDGLKRRAAVELGGCNESGGTRQQFGEIGGFVQALEAALDLTAARCPVAAPVAVDWDSLAITWAGVAGVRFHELAPHVAEAAVEQLEQALISIHRAGYVLDEIDRQSVLFGSHTGALIAVDVSRAVPIVGVSRDMSVYLRDMDRLRFNELFGTRLLTAPQLRSLLSPKAQISRERAHGFTEVYAPVLLRDDIRWGKIWNTDLGTGRWNFIMKGHLPIPVGGSVLDLGSNNGFNPLQMLRAGAASAVGIEIHEPAIEQAKFLKAAYEWLDNRSYDFRSIHASSGDLPALDLPRFDVVTALCSLYYLEDAEIRRLVRYIRTRTDTLVLQCNTDRLIDRGGDEEIFRKASVEFAVEVLDQAGFTKREIVAPAGYSRPLVIARA